MSDETQVTVSMPMKNCRAVIAIMLCEARAVRFLHSDLNGRSTGNKLGVKNSVSLTRTKCQSAACTADFRLATGGP